jgi:hypothetical protein
MTEMTRYTVVNVDEKGAARLARPNCCTTPVIACSKLKLR